MTPDALAYVAGLAFGIAAIWVLLPLALGALLALVVEAMS